MPKTVLQELWEFGQSIWLDNISRTLINSGGLKQMLNDGVTGLTSNPSIFDKAISASSDYDKKIQELSSIGKSTFEIYDDLTVRDVQDAADLFKEVYEKTQRKDGYVSLEVNPKLATQVEETKNECKRLYRKVDRPNVMFKIPGTEEAFSAIEELLGEGININVTLIFSLEQYIKTAHAFLHGIERFAQKKGDLSKVASVASVFISRVDTVIDKALEERIKGEHTSEVKQKLESLRGKAAVANTKVIFGRYLDIFSDERFKHLSNKGARIQRVLWGSTGTKNPAYSDIKYVEELIGKDTVNTIPDKTLNAFLDHGTVGEALTSDIENAENIIRELMGYGIDINAVCAKLLQDGVIAFEKSFDSLLESIRTKSKQLVSS